MSKRNINGLSLAQQVKNLPEVQETQEMRVWSLGGEDPMQEKMATHSTILVWKIQRKKEPGRLKSKGSQGVGHEWATKHILSVSHTIVLTLWDPMNCSPPVSTVSGILQAIILDWVAITFSRRSSRGRTSVSCIGRQILYLLSLQGSQLSIYIWRREWQSTRVFLPGESHGQRSLAGYSPWGCRESDRTKRLSIYIYLRR